MLSTKRSNLDLVTEGTRGSQSRHCGGSHWGTWIEKRRGLLDDVTTSIPLWVPLVVAILGLIGTAGGAIAGVVITQRRSDARDKTAWEREHARERERWAREDAARTFELRREACVELHATVHWHRVDFEIAQLFRDQTVKAGEALRLSIQNAMYSAQEKVRIYGSSVVVEVAEKIWMRMERTVRMFDSERLTDENLKALKIEEDELLRLIRADLGIPPGDIEFTEG